ncbi:hypothetical protein BBP40_001281 [Aspergillus hancockii]|nr:hypothetical protein BBP40_001281 [Aspergillus hancockii]
MALSEKLNLLDSGTDLVTVEGVEGIKYIECLHCGVRITSFFVGATDWFYFLRTKSVSLFPHLRLQWVHGQNFGKIVSTLAGIRLERHQCGHQLSDFLACLIEDKSGNARCISRMEIEAETNILMDAGSDTTAISLTHALYYLIKNPRSLDTLRKEVDSVLSEESIAPYAKIAGENIPGDVAVSVPTYVAHRDPTIFLGQDEFRPERWFEDGEKAKQMPDAFIPFSIGARGCIGRNISMIEQQIVIATLVHRYDFSLPSDDWSMEWEEAFLLWPAQMPLKIWRKENLMW